jgi:hypothetical protein
LKSGSNRLVNVVNERHTNPGVPFLFCGGGIMPERQMRLWDVVRLETALRDGKVVSFIWVSYDGKEINCETFKFMKVDRNGKNNKQTAKK